MKILIVEDDAIEAMDIKRTVESFGYSVPYVASRGDEAITKALEIKPDLILMDIIIKGKLNGIETASKIKNLNIPIIFLTAHSEANTVKKAKLIEPYGYLIKPYDALELKSTIELALYKSSQEKKIKESEVIFRSLYENSFDAILLTKTDGSILSANPAAQKMFGRTEKEIIKVGRTGIVVENEDLKKILEKLGQKSNIKAVLTFKRKNGSTFLGEGTSSFFTDADGIIKNSMIIRDVTERENAQDKLNLLNRKLLALSKCNQTLLRAVNEETLLNEICHIICDEAGYRLAWVGYAEQDNDKTIRPVAWAGQGSGYIAKSKFSWSEDTKYGEGPAGIVIRSGEPIYVQDFVTDPLMAPWRESILKRGYRSGIALPLKDKKAQTFGVLLIYSAEPNAINNDEIWLMEELAGNLEFGITSLREQAEKKNVEEELRAAGLYNRSLIEASLDPLVTIGTDGKITDVNQATEKVTGFSRDELISTDFSDYFTEPDKAKKGYQKVFKEGQVRDYPLKIQNQNGHITPVLYNASLYQNESGDVVGVFAAARDITESSQTKKKLKDSEERMRLTLEATQIGLWEWDVEKDKWYASPTYYSMLGYEPKLGKGDRKEWLERVHPDDQAEVQEKINNVLNQNFNSYEYEARMLHVDGNYRWVSVSGFSTERDSSGKATRILGIRMDITNRKNAEEKLRAAGLYNRSLIEASLDPLVTIGTDGKITDVNQATEKVTGFSRDELISTDFSDYFTEPDKAKKGYQKVFKEGQVRDYPLKIQNQNGHITPVLYNASLYRNESGEVVGVFAAARDITERQKAEENIMMLANVVESSDDAIIVKSLEGRIINWNKGAKSIYGYSANEIIGENISILAPVDLKNEINELIKKIKNNEHVVHYETVRVRKDGSQINVSLTLSPIFDISGSLVGVSTIARDITQSKKAEIKVKESEEFLDNIVENIPNMIFVKNAEDLSLKRVNKVGELYFGHPTNELVGKSDYDFFPKDIADFFTEKDRKALQSKKMIDIPEETIQTLKLGTRILHTKKIPLFDKKGNPRYLLGISEDITELKKAENKLKESLIEKEILLREIHHRVKNNMQIISSLLNIQKNFVKDKEADNVLLESQNRVKSMAMIHERLYQSQDFTHINISEYIERLVADLVYTYSGSNEQVTCEIDLDDLNLNIETAIPIGLIISELVSNSLKYAFPQGKKGKINVSLKAREEYNELIIYDEGVGFPEDLDFRKTKTLGLQLVNNLVDQLDGEITLDKSQGSQFKIIFKELQYKDRI